MTISAVYPENFVPFAEYCEVKNVNVKSITTRAIAARRAAFDEYISQGGFPELQFIREDKEYIDGLVDAYSNCRLSDVTEKHSVSTSQNMRWQNHH